MEKELKLSPKERQLLEPFFESDVYQMALRPFMKRWGQSICGYGTMQSQDLQQVMVARGKAQMLKDLDRFFQKMYEDARKKRETK